MFHNKLNTYDGVILPEILSHKHIICLHIKYIAFKELPLFLYPISFRVLVLFR